MKKYTIATASLRALEANFDKLSIGEFGDVSEYLQNKDGDTLIDSFYSDDCWYRIYASGWVEQGGSFTPTASTTIVSLPIEMQDNVYYAHANHKSNTGTYYGQCYNLTTTAMTIKTASGYDICWEVKGVKA